MISVTSLFDFLCSCCIGYKTGHVRLHNTGVSEYSLTPKLLSAKPILKMLAILTEGSFGSFHPGREHPGSVPHPDPPSPPGRDRQVAKIRRLRDSKGGGGTRWRGVRSCRRVCSVVLQRAPLKRSIPSLALPWLPPPTPQKLGAHPQ